MDPTGAEGEVRMSPVFPLMPCAPRWEPAVARALRLATTQGRMKFVRPLYR